MFKYIWLVPLLPLAGAAINGIFGRWLRFPESLIGGIAVGTVALSFLISLTAVISYGFGSGDNQKLREIRMLNTLKRSRSPTRLLKN